MNRNISPRDIELLSAYLDQQLESGQRARLEARLRADIGLRAAYQDLRQTRALLRSLPRLKAPRNFSLSPEMVGRSRAKAAPARRIYPLFQFASALAGILLVVVLLGDFLGIGVRMAGAPAAEAPQPPEALALEKRVGPAESERAAEVTTTTEQAGGVQDLHEAPAATEDANRQFESLAAPMAEMTPTITTTMPLTMTIPLTETTPISPQVGILPEGEATPPGYYPGPLTQEEVPPPGRLIWRATEISLAALAVSSGLAAVYLRRKHGPRR